MPIQKWEMGGWKEIQTGGRLNPRRTLNVVVLCLAFNACGRNDLSTNRHRIPLLDLCHLQPCGLLAWLHSLPQLSLGHVLWSWHCRHPGVSTAAYASSSQIPANEILPTGNLEWIVLGPTCFPESRCNPLWSHNSCLLHAWKPSTMWTILSFTDQLMCS